ncbi:hypothetical protein [Bythopirellula polymerisocia]|uniref:NAD-specific glutamate dehydrogenase n=1 Tax=Bythopirellula polymerisocia TaxID=2528003 RepID=A0A5C6CV18_9BACT|nr:hypothetical protein [Bythopirellula polymerisocia]TWU27665.1 NAD-specific glutamate dehydrogenase [Bythopirellula polymerisocia]
MSQAVEKELGPFMSELKIRNPHEKKFHQAGLERNQNAMRFSWSREEVDERLQHNMQAIHKRCVDHGTTDGRVNYTDEANIADLKKVADAMLSYEIVYDRAGESS